MAARTFRGRCWNALGLRKAFTIRKAGLFSSARAAAQVVAVDDVSLKIERGECLGSGRRERLRQDHLKQSPVARGDAGRGHDHLQ